MNVKIIGVGNSFRSDDRAGISCAEQIDDRLRTSVEIEFASGEGADLMARFEDADVVFVVDAARSGAEPGTIHRFDASREPIPSSFFNYSSHAFGVAEAIELARSLGHLPGWIVVLGIEGANFEPGEALTPSVEEAVSRAAADLSEEIEELFQNH